MGLLHMRRRVWFFSESHGWRFGRRWSCAFQVAGSFESGECLSWLVLGLEDALYAYSWLFDGCKDSWKYVFMVVDCDFHVVRWLSCRYWPGGSFGLWKRTCVRVVPDGRVELIWINLDLIGYSFASSAINAISKYHIREFNFIRWSTLQLNLVVTTVILSTLRWYSRLDIYVFDFMSVLRLRCIVV